MRGISLWRCVLLLVALAPFAAGAVGMGKLTVLSTLGQPFRAEIDLIAVHKDELSSLSARIASADEYKQQNLQYGPSIGTMRVAIQARRNGHYYLSISTARPINELFVNLLVELNWNNGHILRAYSALIDPPGFAPAQITAPAAATESRPLSQRAPIAAAPLATAKPAKEYGPVKRGETLSKIARSTKPEGVSVEQMLVGLYRSNPDAFIHHNMNLLKAGAKLKIPGKDELDALSTGEAAKEVRLQTTNWRQYRRKLADMAGKASETRHEEPKKVPGKVVDEGAAGKPAKDVLRLSTGVPPGKKSEKKAKTSDRVRVLEEELVAREKALKDANERIKELEKAVKSSAAKGEGAK